MTESEWLTCNEPTRMLEHLGGKVTDRKGQLYVCGGCQQIAHLFYDPASTQVVEVAERFADGLASEDERHAASWSAECPTFGYDFEAGWHNQLFDDPQVQARFDAAEMKAYRWQILTRLVEMGALSESALTGEEWRVNEPIRDQLLAAARIAERCAITSLPRIDEWWRRDFSLVNWPGRWLIDCIFGNLFRPVAADPRWRTSAVVGLAEGIYEDRAFDRLPILADALEEAGCDNDAILAHCRGDGPHVRGCWVVDLILGKE